MAIDPDILVSFVRALAHSLWQAALMLGIVILLRPVARRMSASARHSILAIAMLGCVAGLVITFGVFVSEGGTQVRLPRVPATPFAEMHLASSGQDPASTPPAPRRVLPSANPVPTPSTPPAAPTAGQASAVNDSAAVPWWYGRTHLLAAAYGLGVAAMSLRLALAVRGSRRLRLASEPVTDLDVLRAYAEQARRIGLHISPAIAVCARVAVPCVVGVFQPVVLLPVGLTAALTPSQLAQVLAHELAHVRRFDHIAIVVQRLIEALLFFNPSVWVLSRMLTLERESCCDEMVTGASRAESLQYVELLTRLAANAGTGGPSLAATGADPSDLYVRLRRLLGASEFHAFRSKASWAAVSIALLASAVAVQAAVPFGGGVLRVFSLGISKEAGSLHRAAAMGDLRRLRAALLAGEDPNSRDNNGWTPLHHAASALQAGTVRMLLDFGADPDADGPRGRIPLHAAIGISAPGLPLIRKPIDGASRERFQAEAAERRIAVVRELAPVTNCTRADNTGFTPLHAAAAMVDGPTIALITPRSALNARANNGLTPLVIACTALNVPAIEQLLAAGADPLMETEGLNAIERLVLTEGGGRMDWEKRAAAADLFQTAIVSKGHKPDLFLALISRRVDLVRQILRDDPASARGSISPGLRAWAKFEPVSVLRVAATSDLECLREVLPYSDMSLPSDRPADRTYVEAALTTSIENFRFLVEAHPELLESHPGDGVTPLLFACRVGKPALVQACLELGARIDVRDAWGHQPVMSLLNLMTRSFRSAAGDSLEIDEQLRDVEAAMTLLLDHGATTEAVVPGRLSALHMAVSIGADRLVRLLVSRGASLDSLDDRGRTPEEAARASGRREIEAYLRAARTNRSTR